MFTWMTNVFSRAKAAVLTPAHITSREAIYREVQAEQVPAAQPAPITSNPVKGETPVANILVNVEKGIEVAAEDVLKFITGAQKQLSTSPAVIAAIGTLLGAVAAAITSTEAAAAGSGLNITLDTAAFDSIKAVWPQVVLAAASIGLKL